MIVWLASYPRSGNTMLRNMMRQVFALESYSIYDDKMDIGERPEISARTGHKFLGSEFDEFYRKQQTGPELALVKTHGPPIDAGPAIYVIRDGRSSIVSWYNMLINLRKRTDVTLSDVILGRKVAFGDWSSHVRSWSPKTRPNTLLLKYHDLVNHPAEAIAKISKALNRPPAGAWQNDFAELHKMFPEFFHRGSDEQNINQMSPQEQKLFWLTHGDTMREYGFSV